ncbi:hypothetical protein FHG87_002610 [Trinorchestia longiramus]|nr:hypothetical protein FHG87_002610 [Trinorchestia longiramus]
MAGTDKEGIQQSSASYKTTFSRIFDDAPVWWLCLASLFESTNNLPAVGRLSQQNAPGKVLKRTRWSSVSQSAPYRPPGGVEEMQGGGRRVRLEWGAYITV